MTLEFALARRRRELGRPHEDSQRVWADREWLQISLHDGEGHRGLGEAAPLPGYSDEGLAEAERALLDWAQRSRASAEALVERATKTPACLRGELSRITSVPAPSARFAIESALLALVAERRREPLTQVLLALSGRHEPATGLPLAQLISHERAEEEAAAALADGFSTLKLKVGTRIGLSRELETLTRLRDRFGNAFALRVDGNQSFSNAEARALLSRLLPLGVEFVEEPLRRGEPELENPDVPIALDESLRTASNFGPATLARHGVRALILKPTVLGGLCSTLTWVERARQLGLAWVLSHTFESSLGYRALAAFALSLGPAPSSHGLGPHSALDCAPETLGVRSGKLWALDREAA